MHGKMVCFSDMEEEDIIIITHRFIRDFVQELWREKLLIMRNIRQSWDGRLIMKSTVKWMSFIQRQILLRFVNFSENSMELWRN